MRIIETARLTLRTWKKKDADAYFLINQDPKVLEFLPGPLTIEKIYEFIDRCNIQQKRYGYTLWATELKETDELIGFIGLNYTDWKAHFTPAVEIGWRLGSQYWGKGYATEGAKTALDYGFNKCGLKEIVSFTVPDNKRSIKLMERLNLKQDFKGDFIHPKLPTNHRLSKHVLYRIRKKDY